MYMQMWQDSLRRKRRKSYSYYSSNSSTKAQKFAKFTKLLFIGLLIFTGLLIIIFPLFAFDLPSPDKVVRREGFSTKILDRNGQVLYDIFADQKRIPASFTDIPLYLRQATVAIEDKNFYSHQGFDPTGIVRAFFNTVTKRKLQGGSTLTQQLVKNVLLTPDRTIFRKIREFILTAQIERKYTKDQILQMYLNEVPYGGTAWGVEAAAETYFGKKVKDLNLTECAFLAGLPQRPSAYSPYSTTPKAYIGRTTEVLRRMREDGYINKNQEENAKNALSSLDFEPKGGNFKAPHFVQYVQKILEDRYGANAVEQGGLRVTTTLDWNLQEKAQEIITGEIAKVEKIHITNGAAVAVNPQTGEILAMVGSKDFNAIDYDGQVNVTTSLRQPGSAIKPFTYATAFKKGYTPASLIMDVPTIFPGGIGQPEYKPVNYDGKYRGPTQLRFALGNSINIPAVKLLAQVGIKDMLQTAFDAGITSLEPNQQTLNRVGLSVTLGGGEVKLLDLTSAFSIFVNKGYRVDPIALLKVEDSTGAVLEEAKPQKGKKVLSDEEAFLVADILSDNKARTDVFGPNSLLNFPDRQVVVKTGTTNDRRDNWAMGGTPQVVVGTWVGNNDNSPMQAVASGVSGASPIWRKILQEALRGKPSIRLEVPPNIVSAEVDTVSGYRAHDGFPSRTEYFIKGTEPGEDPVHTKLKVCKNDGKLANPSDIAAGNYDEKEFFIFKEEDPTSNGGQNRWQEGILNWLTTLSDERYRPPTDYCGTSNPMNVEFVNPTDKNSNLPNSFTIKVNPSSPNEIVRLDLEVNGQNVRSFSGPPYEHEVNLANGIYELRAFARDSKNYESERKIKIGVGVPWDASPSPSP